ncbi:DUF3037 domain-containing protein [Massilia timonae]|uniref:DUF3037 domain-containing protein n=1 Tax=Massilia timonae TaxID=47229 RepID=UPI002353CA9E|nr:DUF3037 domain-containing protein [Massilia timonae]
MTNPCLYAIVRFCPYVETEEFANAGIVMISPQTGFFSYKLMGRKHARVTTFFEDVEGALFRTALSNLKDELDRIKDQLLMTGWPRGTHADDLAVAKQVFGELTRPRETIIKFGNVRGVLAEKPKAKLEELYGYYVERDFVTKQYRESVLEKEMRAWISKAGIGSRFEKKEVGTEDYHATFPFVEGAPFAALKAIKPLYLGHDQPSKILDHGGQWLFRVQTLKRKGLMPQLVLFAAEGPQDDGAKHDAYKEITETLQHEGAIVLDFKQQEAILEYMKSPVH